MKAIKYIPQEINLDVTEVTIPSIEEIKKIKMNFDIDCDCTWWLRPSGNNSHNVPYITDLRDVFETDLYVHFEYGVRPLLRITNLESSNLKLGDKIEIFGEKFTIVLEGRALADSVVGYSAFRKDWRAEDANDYEKSDLKSWLENWRADND